MTTKIKWQKAYEIGVEEIDNEHKVFLKTIQKIDEAFIKEFDLSYIALLIDELYKYAQFHFTSEENIMILHNYPDYMEHKEIHQKLLTQLGGLMGFRGNKQVEHQDLINFLIDWFKAHTIKTDLKLAEFLNQKNITNHQ